MVYHVINRGVGRQQLVFNDEDYLAFDRVIVETLEIRAMRVLSYCLMPNHWPFSMARIDLQILAIDGSVLEKQVTQMRCVHLAPLFCNSLPNLRNFLLRLQEQCRF
jgi:hypothetical protein